jgi:ribosomal protein S18 acetylase RimI-like enzyme
LFGKKLRKLSLKAWFKTRSLKRFYKKISAAGYNYHAGFNILPEFTGSGYGSKLLTLLLETLAERGADGIAISVLKSNERAIDFFKKRGFVTFKRNKNSLDMGLKIR